MSVKKILIFSLAYYPHVGGAEVAIKEITDRIAPSDIEFHMVTQRFAPDDAVREKIGNVYVHRIGAGGGYASKILFIPRAAVYALKLNTKQKFDAAWAMMSYMMLPLVLMRIVGIAMPYALTLQEGDTVGHVFGRWYIRMFYPLLRYGFKHATVVQAISNFLGGWARERGFNGTAVIIPNGVDVAQFMQLSPAASMSVLKKFNIHQNEIVLVTTSRLVRKNAIDTVIRALPLLSGVHFIVAGKGSEEAALKKLAAELGIEARVHFAGHVDARDLPAYVHAGGIFIRPSRSEGMGNSFIEAMAAGLPVIATQEGGIADFLFDRVRNPDKEPTGFAVDADSPEQIAAAVHAILSNPGNTQEVVKNAYRMVAQRYDWSLIARDMREKVFSRLFA